MLSLVFVASAILLPSWLSLVVVVPIAWILINASILPPLFTIGNADILVVDIVIVAVAGKVMAMMSMSRTMALRPFPTPVALYAFLLTIIVATLASYFRFDQSIFIGELVPLLRFLVQVSTYFLLVLSLQKSRQVRSSCRAVYLVGFILASSIYLAVALDMIGITFEVLNTREGQYTRYQGILGDSVKLVLLPFIFWSVLSKRYWMALFFVGALVATGGRLGIIGLLIGVAVMLKEFSNQFRSRQWLLFAAFAVTLIGLGAWLGIGAAVVRFFSQQDLAYVVQRMGTWYMGVHVFLDNPLTGVGYGGFRFFSADYLEVLGEESKLFGIEPFMEETYSQVLKATTDAGIAGLVAFIWMMISFSKVIRRATLASTGDVTHFLQAGYVFLIVLSVLSLVNAWMLPASMVSYLLWIFLGIATATVAIHQQNERFLTSEVRPLS